MRRTIVYLLAALFLATACEYEFTPDIKSESRWYLQCIAHLDSTNVLVEYATPAGEKRSSEKTMPDLCEVSVNDRTFDATEGGWMFPRIEPGDRITVRATGRNLEEASGSTVMPELPEVDSVTREEILVLDSASYTRLDVHLAKAPEPGEFFAVTILCETIFQTQDTSYTYYGHESAIMQDGEGGIMEYAVLNRYDWCIAGLEGPVILFPAESFKGSTCSLTLTRLNWAGSQGLNTETRRYKLQVCGVSEELYRYSVSRYKSSSDYLSILGLAPPQFAWSNIKGGLGVCGAIAVTETGWVE